MVVWSQKALITLSAVCLGFGLRQLLMHGELLMPLHARLRAECGEHSRSLWRHWSCQVWRFRHTLASSPAGQGALLLRASILTPLVFLLSLKAVTVSQSALYSRAKLLLVLSTGFPESLGSFLLMGLIFVYADDKDKVELPARRNVHIAMCVAAAPAVSHIAVAFWPLEHRYRSLGDYAAILWPAAVLLLFALQPKRSTPEDSFTLHFAHRKLARVCALAHYVGLARLARGLLSSHLTEKVLLAVFASLLDTFALVAFASSVVLVDWTTGQRPVRLPVLLGWALRGGPGHALALHGAERAGNEARSWVKSSKLRSDTE